MAVGDAINAIAVVATGASLTVQPAAGQEYLITGVCSGAFVGTKPDMTYQATLFVTDGVILSPLALNNNNPDYHKNLRLPISNTFYMFYTNNNAAVQALAAFGIRIK